MYKNVPYQLSRKRIKLHSIAMNRPKKGCFPSLFILDCCLLWKKKVCIIHSKITKVCKHITRIDCNPQRLMIRLSEDVCSQSALFFYLLLCFLLVLHVIFIISTLYRKHWIYIQILLFAFQTYFASFIILRVHYQKYSFTRSLRQIIHIQVWWYCFKSVGIIQLRYTPSACLYIFIIALILLEFYISFEIQQIPLLCVCRIATVIQSLV